MKQRRINADDYDHKFRINSGFGKLYWNVYLFKDAEAMYRNTRAPGCDNDYLGQHRPKPYFVNVETGKPKSKPLIGEIHLVAGRWNLEIVAHEVQHAVFHLLRVCDDVQSISDDDMETEERYCYFYGMALDGLYSELLKADRHEKAS